MKIHIRVVLSSFVQVWLQHMEEKTIKICNCVCYLIFKVFLLLQFFHSFSPLIHLSYKYHTSHERESVTAHIGLAAVQQCLDMPKIHYTRFLVTFPQTGNCGKVTNLLQTCCGLVSDTANKSATSWQQVVVMEFGKWHDTTDITDFRPRQLVTDLLRGNWCNGFWPIYSQLIILLKVSSRQGRGGKQLPRPKFYPVDNFLLVWNLLRESIDRKGIFTLIFRKPGWTEQIK